MKDNNADLGNQVIEGTSPPIDLEAEIVMPDGSSRPIPMPSAEPDSDLDAQLAAMLDGDEPSEPIILSGEDSGADPVITPPPLETEPLADNGSDLDAQLQELLDGAFDIPDTDGAAHEAATSGSSADEPIVIVPPLADEDSVITPPPPLAEEEPTIVPPPPPITKEDNVIATPPPPPSAEEPANDTERADAPTAAELDAELEALLENKPLEEDLDAKLDRIMDLPPDDAPAQPVEPVAEAPAPPAEPVAPAATAPSAEAEEARRMMEEARKLMDEVRLAQEQAKIAQEQAELKAQQAELRSQQPFAKPAPDDGTLDAAREMMRQAQLMMQQAQQAQQQPQQQASAHSSTAALEMIRQAQLMMQQAQQAQFQAQQTAQQAQFNAALQAQQPAAATTDPYAIKEVDRLKNELDGMRELVNKLTFTIAQNPGGAAAGQFMQQPRFGDSDHEQYRKLETELERMRREILEKDLRDREKELDRRQKEAENSVKDIRPEMVQMSDSRDIAPIGNGMPAGAGSEFIPLANGVFYSIKDKQVYVMTPASNAAAARPTIEPPARKPAPAKRKPAPARPAARRRPAPPRRPGAPMGRRRPGGARPRPHR